MYSTLRRVAESILLVWLVVTLLFVLVRMAPGDPADFILPPGATEEVQGELRNRLGLNESVLRQYIRWVTNTARGDLGESFSQRRPVTEVLRDALPVSIYLGAISLGLTFLLGVTVGMFQATRLGTRTDTAVTIITTAVFAAPSFWLSLTLVSVFTYGAATLGLPAWARLPAFGMFDPAAELTGVQRVLDLVRHSVLPIAVLTAIGAAGIARYSRSSVAEIINLDFVRTARAKGVTRGRLYGLHLLRNILPPLVVLAALSFPGLISGAVFVETVFAWPGMGRTIVDAISARDYPLVLGAALVYGTVVIFANLAADLLLPLLDPRRRQ